MAVLIFALLQALLANGTPIGHCRSGSQSQDLFAVNTTSGVYAPCIADSFPSVAAFPDIPYAQNPTGPLRFAPPVPVRPHDNDGVVYATELPLGCFQYTPPLLEGTVALEAETSFLLQGGDYANTTEDCLRLSVFAPRDAVSRSTAETASRPEASEEGLPVVVWIHGGGFSIGGTNLPYQLSPDWVERSQEHIVVQVQYRLGLLGQPNAAGLAAFSSNSTDNHNLNLGFLDQRLAVEWVRDNIANFGGDPNRITLWGQSAGGYATDGYLFAWADDPIVNGVISNSGNAVAIPVFLADATNHSVFSTAADRLGCGGLSPAEELACMRAVPASQIKAYIQAPPGAGGAADDSLVFNPVIDNVTWFPDYPGRIASKDPSLFASHVPLLISTLTNEGGAVVPYDFNGSATATELPPDLAVIAEGFAGNLRCTTLREVQLRAGIGATTYRHLYAGNFSDISPRPWLGAYHTADLPMVFGTFGTEGPVTGFEKSVSERMQDRYLEFIKDPVSGLKNAGWPEATGALDDLDIMTFAADDKLEQLVTGAQFNLGEGCT
ncbi:triacylglycerol lipase FGL5 [Xylariaceae sp. FL1651]|nr:triacylglycerol lipase FGL5 [Xylariaceae sp. FL1651]